MMEGNGLIKGLIVGGLVGAALGILYAPKSGKETRLAIRDGAEDLLEKAKEQYEETIKAIEKLAAEQKKALSLKKGKIKKAVECGVEAFQGEKSGAEGSDLVS